MRTLKRHYLKNVRPEERTALKLGFGFHFFVLASYYLVRPLRDSLGLQSGADNLHWLFTATFIVMLLVIPAFGYAVSRLAARQFVPLFYRLAAAILICFGLLLHSGVKPVLTGQAFFVWVSIYNLFIISVFWSVLVDCFTDEQGKRLFGFIAAGGTLGTFLGPLIAAALSELQGPVTLTLLTAVMLEVAVRLYKKMLLLRNQFTSGPVHTDKGTGGSMIAGISLIAKSPYLTGVVFFMLLHTSAATFLYVEQGHIVQARFTDVADRTRFFALVDLTVSVLTLIFQCLLTGPALRLLGIGGALSMLPLATLVAFAGMSVAPGPWMIALVQGLRRAVEFSVVRPAREVLWTGVSREEKFKAKNVVETVVYRGGDAASGWLLSFLNTAGSSFGIVTAFMIPLTACWSALCYQLARTQRKKSMLSEQRELP